MALPAANPPDIDNLLTRYRTARAQQALFDVRSGASTGYDEFVDAAGNVRPAWQELAECVGERGRGGLDQLRSIVRGLVDNDGITYIEVDRNGDAVTNGDGTAEPGPWHLDALPLVLSASDWDTLESGLVQRSRLLDAVLTDLYGPRQAVTSGVLPPQLLFAHPGYVRAARGIDVPGRHQLFLHGCDISRAADGGFLVNADWTQAPSGAGYALADRRVVAHAIPELYERIGPRPASPWAQALRLALIDAAPESAEEPVVVVLSPGIHSETAFDQAYLASVLGFPLVESADLVVRDGKLWMRSMGTLKRVDVVLRRVDADYADPLDLRADSRLGVVGLVEVLRRGAVTVVNTLGSGILESAGLLRFLPELAERLLGETPLLETAPVYWGGINTERSHLLDQPVVTADQAGDGRRPDRRPGIVGHATRVVGRAHRGHALAVGGPGAAAVLVGTHRLLPGRAVVGQRRYAVVHGVAAQWIRADDRRAWLPLGPGQRRLPVEYRCGQGHLGTHADACHSRAHSERGRAACDDAQPDAGGQFAACVGRLFWMGRYAERAENMARLLTVTRERYHEYRYRREMEGSECVPVLLSALGHITGTDTGAGGDYAEMVATAQSTLWSLTADRHRPGSLAQSVERVSLAARAVRDQMSNDTWMVLAAVERAVLHRPTDPPESQAEGDAFLVVDEQPDAGRHARSVRSGGRVDGAGRRLDDDGHRQTDRTRPRADSAAACHPDEGREAPWQSKPLPSPR